MKNHVSLIGRLGQDVTTREHAGKKVSSFSIATSETYKDKEGEKKEITEWHKCTLWGHDGVLPFLTKGKLVSLDGRIKYGSYEKEVNGGSVAIPTAEVEVNAILLM